MKSSIKEEMLFSVGEVCKQTGITRKTLFYYDKIGLLKPAERTRTQQFKRYDSGGLDRLRKILAYRKAGLNIAEIRHLLDDPGADRLQILNGAMRRLLDQKAGIDREIRNLEALVREEKSLTVPRGTVTE